MSQFIANQKWRYATKAYDKEQKISDTQLRILKEAIQLTASSYGFQPYKVIQIDSIDLREKIMNVAFGQKQIVEASHLFVFASAVDFGSDEIHSFFEHVKNQRQLNDEQVSNYKNFVLQHFESRTKEDRDQWATNQAYIALGNLLAAAAELNIDVTPMEGFIPTEVDKILGLESLRLRSVLLAPIGIRCAEDVTQFFPKVRKPIDELFSNL